MIQQKKKKQKSLNQYNRDKGREKNEMKWNYLIYTLKTN